MRRVLWLLGLAACNASPAPTAPPSFERTASPPAVERPAPRPGTPKPAATLDVHPRTALTLLPDPCEARDESWACGSARVIPPDTVDIAPTADGPCLVTSDGRVRCGDRVLPLSGGATQLDADAQTVCTLGPRRVECTARRDDAPVVSFPQLDAAVRISVGNGQICGLSSTFGLRCFAVDAKPTDPPALELSDAVDAGLGSSHGCALRGDRVWCWGWGTNGELGDGRIRGDDEGPGEPAEVPELEDAIQLAVGSSFSCARHRDGTVSCWGQDLSGQLGRGRRWGASAVPSPVLGVTDATDLAADGSSACVRHGDDTLSCWGTTPTDDAQPIPAAPGTRLPPRVPLARGCRSFDLDVWTERIEAAANASELEAALAEIGRPLVNPDHEESWMFDPELVSVDVRQAELSRAPGLESLIEVQLHMRGVNAWEEATAAVVQVLYADGDGRSCLADGDLSTRLRVEAEACMDHPKDGAMEAPQQLDFVPVLSRRHHAIRRRTQSGACWGYPRASTYETSFWALRKGKLRRIFDPFETYAESHSVESDPEWHEGRVTLVGGFPRRIQTVHHVRCDASVDIDPDDPPPPCTPATVRKTFRFNGTTYR